MRVLHQEIGEFVQWNSLYVHAQVYEAMLLIADSCREVSEMRLFSLRSSRALPLDEFVAQQLQTSHAIVNRLREQWIGNVTRIVRMCLRDIGKGWFDLQQRRSDVYDVMKLKRFMTLVRCHMQVPFTFFTREFSPRIYIYCAQRNVENSRCFEFVSTVHGMQSALRTMVECSSMEYLMALVIPNSSLLEVPEDFIWSVNLKDSPFESSSAELFQMHLCMNDEGAFYDTKLELFEVSS